MCLRALLLGDDEVVLVVPLVGVDRVEIDRPHTLDAVEPGDVGTAMSIVDDDTREKQEMVLLGVLHGYVRPQSLEEVEDALAHVGTHLPSPNEDRIVFDALFPLPENRDDVEIIDKAALRRFDVPLQVDDRPSPAVNIVLQPC